MSKMTIEPVLADEAPDSAPSEQQAPKKRATRKGTTDKKVAILQQSQQLSLMSYTEQRQSILDFVGSQLKENIDYGFPYKGSDKKSLLKPGAEKFCSLLRLEPVFINDTETWQLFGTKEGMICMICFLLTQERKMEVLKQIGKIGADQKMAIYQSVAVSEGRGAGQLDERSTMTPNTLVKMVEKRALVDAVLRVAGLSEIFTQDGEDQQQDQPKAQGGKKPPKARQAAPPQRQQAPPANKIAPNPTIEEKLAERDAAQAVGLEADPSLSALADKGFEQAPPPQTPPVEAPPLEETGAAPEQHTAAEVQAMAEKCRAGINIMGSEGIIKEESVKENNKEIDELERKGDYDKLKQTRTDLGHLYRRHHKGDPK